MENFFQWFSREAAAAELQFLLAGGNAVNAYGYQRTTFDVDFIVIKEDLTCWKGLLEAGGYLCFHETPAFCQFESSDDTVRLPVDLMLVDAGTFEKLSAERKMREVAAISYPVPSVLHIIALKLHALRDKSRAAQGKDMPDILGLIERCEIDTGSVEFTSILDRYADELTREELTRRLELRRRLRSESPGDHS